jgi:hypothetical protein
VPWLTIGYGKFNGSQTSLYYSGGVGAPEGTSRRDSGLQLWLISPNGMGTTIPVGPRDENVKENPEPGLWTIKGQLPNQPAFNLGVNYKF